MQLTALSNSGINLWCIQKYVLQVQAGQAVYPLPTGITDIINVLSRSSVELVPLNVVESSDALTAQYSLPTAVGNVSLLFAVAGTVYLTLECSNDGSVWRSVAVLDQRDVNTGDRIVFDADNSQLALLWRVRTTAGDLPEGTVMTLNGAGQDLPMTILNRDDYMNLPNKQFSVPSGQRSLQYWFDKQVDPQLWIWPISQGSVDQIVVWAQRQIQDVGAFSNTIDVPQRWYQSVLATLSTDLCLEIPPQEVPPGRYAELVMDATNKRADAEDGESDGAPTRLAPNLRPYTA